MMMMMMRMMLILLILPKATLAWLEASGKGQLPRCLQLGTYIPTIYTIYVYFQKYNMCCSQIREMPIWVCVFPLIWKQTASVHSCAMSLQKIYPFKKSISSDIKQCDKWWGEYNIRHWSWCSRVKTSNFTTSPPHIVLIWVELRSV